MCTYIPCTASQVENCEEGSKKLNVIVAVKTKRIELRGEEATLDRIQHAANIVHEQTSEFVRKAAMQRAENVLPQDLVTVMPARTVRPADVLTGRG
jgi:uncharacterized protein (DUF1778 family)